ncbi:MAG: molecular chaperone HtpG [Clostridia bacterium]|nr:molecular chaperone HtpG [Clostridia bacterium]
MKQFKTQSKRILDLMINSIYTNKEIFLRELISNASDALDKLKFISLTDQNAKQDFAINISIDSVNKTLTIEDTGIGMTEEELEKNLGTIAQSGTLNFKQENQGKTDEELIGQFGVGFYSAFMVADKITVYTKSYNGKQGYKWESKGAEGYTIEECEKDNYGTKIVLKLKEDCEDFKYSDFLQEYKITSLIRRYSDYIRYPIKMEVTKTVKKEGSPEDKPEYEQVKEIETLNSMVPLWKKPKAQVTEEALKEFYKNEFHEYIDPLKGIYSKIEGAVTYDSILYFPQKPSFDYYSKDFKKGLKLYCNGVLIMDKCEDLLPDYFGFVKGIVDSSDLSLNISREILQQSRQVKAIANGIEKKILSELKKMMEEDRETYDKLWTEFGLSIKFGAYAGFGMNKDKLKDLLLFYSSQKEKLVSLAEYVKNAPQDQEFIYYASGESYEQISSLPQIEKAKEKGVEILFFKDGVDEFVAKLLTEYEGKKFKSVSEADFSLSGEDEKKELEKKTEENGELLAKIKEILGDNVKEVKLTDNLKTYPVCLISAGDLSIEMEKVLNAMPNAEQKVKAEKILQISSTHSVLEKLQKLYKEDQEKLSKTVNVLYQSARLLEGLPVDDTPSFVTFISELI